MHLPGSLDMFYRSLDSFYFHPAKFMLIYNHLRKSALTPDDLGVGAVCFLAVYHENSEAKRKERRICFKSNIFEKNIKQENWYRKPWMMSA